MIALSKAAFVVPALVSGLWMVQHAPIESVAAVDVSQAASAQPLVRSLDGEPLVSVATHSDVARRLRVERILSTLDEVTEVAMQMSPEQQARIEPVLAELTESASAISYASAASANTHEASTGRQADRDLDELENTVDRFIHSLARVVEPEIAL